MNKETSEQPSQSRVVCVCVGGAVPSVINTTTNPKITYDIRSHAFQFLDGGPELIPLPSRISKKRRLTVKKKKKKGRQHRNEEIDQGKAMCKTKLSIADNRTTRCTRGHSAQVSQRRALLCPCPQTYQQTAVPSASPLPGTR